jgi:hypothetical protein
MGVAPLSNWARHMGAPIGSGPGFEVRSRLRPSFPMPRGKAQCPRLPRESRSPCASRALLGAPASLGLGCVRPNPELPSASGEFAWDSPERRFMRDPWLLSNRESGSVTCPAPPTLCWPAWSADPRLQRRAAFGRPPHSPSAWSRTFRAMKRHGGRHLRERWRGHPRSQVWLPTQPSTQFRRASCASGSHRRARWVSSGSLTLGVAPLLVKHPPRWDLGGMGTLHRRPSENHSPHGHSSRRSGP